MFEILLFESAIFSELRSYGPHGTFMQMSEAHSSKSVLCAAADNAKSGLQDLRQTSIVEYMLHFSDILELYLLALYKA